MRPPKRENARRQPGIGAKQKIKHIKDTAFQARKQASKNQPSPGALGAKFYEALFGKAVRDE